MAQKGSIVAPVSLCRVEKLDHPANAPCIIGFIVDSPAYGALDRELAINILAERIGIYKREGKLAAAGMAAAMRKDGDNYIVWEYRGGDMREVWRHETYNENPPES